MIYARRKKNDRNKTKMIIKLLLPKCTYPRHEIQRWQEEIGSVPASNYRLVSPSGNLPTRETAAEAAGESRPEFCDVYHRDRTVENRYLDRGKKARQQLGLHVTARAICHPALPICGSYLLSWCRG